MKPYHLNQFVTIKHGTKLKVETYTYTSGLLFSCDHDKHKLHRSSIAPSQDK